MAICTREATRVLRAAIANLDTWDRGEATDVATWPDLQVIEERFDAATLHWQGFRARYGVDGGGVIEVNTADRTIRFIGTEDVYLRLPETLCQYLNDWLII